MNFALASPVLLGALIVGCLVALLIAFLSSSSGFSSRTMGTHLHHALRASRMQRRPPPSSAIARHARCVRDKGFFAGEWQHDPYTLRPEYIHSNNKWGKEHQIFRAQHPLPTDSMALPIKNNTTAAAPASTSSAPLEGLPQYLLYNQYSWMPHDPECAFKPFDRARTCWLLRHHLRARHVLFVGDSITEQQAMSLLLLMGGPSLHNWLEVPAPLLLCETASDAKGGEVEKDVSFYFIRDDYLNTSSHAPWVQHLHSYKPDLVLFNTGAHFYDLPSFQAATDRFLSFIKTDAVLASPTTHLIFRTTVHGHPNCALHTKPVTPAGRPWRSFPGRFTSSFHWDLHPQYNAYTLSRLQEEGLLRDGRKNGGQDGRLLILPADALLGSRPDGHYQGPKEDCLHYHMPGPSDWTNFMLFNLWDTQHRQTQE